MLRARLVLSTKGAKDYANINSDWPIIVAVKPTKNAVGPKQRTAASSQCLLNSCVSFFCQVDQVD